MYMYYNEDFLCGIYAYREFLLLKVCSLAKRHFVKQLWSTKKFSHGVPFTV